MHEYPQFKEVGWESCIRKLLGDIIRNNRRKQFQNERKENVGAPIRKTGRPLKSKPLNKLNSTPFTTVEDSD